MANRFADAGTSQKVKQRFFSNPFGTGNLNQRIERGLNVISPNFRQAGVTEANIDLAGARTENIQEQTDLIQKNRRAAGATVNLNNVFRGLPPSSLRLAQQKLATKGVIFNAQGEANQRQLTEKLQIAGKEDPDAFQAVFKDAEDTLSKGLVSVNTAIDNRAKAITDKFNRENQAEILAGTKEELTVNDVLDTPDFVGKDKELESLLRARDFNAREVNRFRKMSADLEEEQAQTQAVSPFGKIGVSDFTPESLEKFRQTGVFSDLVPVEQGEGKITIKRDEFGKLIGINEQGKEVEIQRLPRPEEGKSGEQMISEINRERNRLLITPGQILAGGGLASNIRSAFNAVVGTAGFPGEVAPFTTEAKAAIKSLNQFIKAGLTINPKNATTELRTIEGFLIDEKSNVQNPQTNITKMINLVNRLQGDLITSQDTINRGNVSAGELQDLTQKVNARIGILSQLPTIAQLKLRSGRIKQMSIEEIESIPEESITAGQAGALIRRFKELGRQ